MQIREQGRQVQLIRSPYDSTKKRCVQKVVHTFKQQYNYSSDEPAKYLSDEQLADLSDDEKKTLSAWLRAKSDKKASDDRKFAIDYASKTIGRLVEAIQVDGINEEQAARTWQSIDSLKKALRKAGHPQPKVSVSA